MYAGFHNWGLKLSPIFLSPLFSLPSPFLPNFTYFLTIFPTIIVLLLIRRWRTLAEGAWPPNAFKCFLR